MYPMNGMGHLVPMVELAKLLTLHDFTVIVVLVNSPSESLGPSKNPKLDAFVSRVSSAHPSISFHQLPPPPLSSLPDPAGNPMLRLLDDIRLNNPQLRHFLVARSHISNVCAVVLDFFCSAALDITVELRLPSYGFFSSGACDLVAFHYLSMSHSAANLNIKDLEDAPLYLPRLPPIPASDLPKTLMSHNETSKRMLNSFTLMLDGADGILVNTFESLEAQAIGVLQDEAGVPGHRVPPAYCIGPLLADGSRDQRQGTVEKADCLVWLDSQPHGSVVFLCFGSLGMFPVEQLKEIAIGLEKSNQRFLWVVRAQQTENEGPQAVPELDALLPEGFMERTKDRGLVVNSWAPQVEVLNHKAVGGFVTHCGWNSILEAITAGVAMVAWPLYAEQRMNKVFLVELMKLAMAMEGYDKDMVTAEEVEAKVRWLMMSDGGRELRERVAATKEMAVEALKEGGSSYRAWSEVVEKFDAKK
ncbi:UDP-glycosyltransferase 88A1-like [Canna indica]|uniref:UDP-glycosyltransferase 88A1-like n=1 Tax=Canna indica TaxID=4628 RepID=A0AAQ3PWN2_9LILI|nr:UDP-glycosyltransferase 88A1-like [Canna indica]